MQKVLVTGGAGLIGSATRRILAGKYEMSCLDIKAVEGMPSHVADIGDLDAILPAFEGIDAVVHLAFLIEGPWEDMLRINVAGTYNVYEAARRAGVKRMVSASSGTVAQGYSLDEPYKSIIDGNYDNVPESWPMVTTDMPYRPDRMYACTKVWLETLARYYADAHDISSVCLRFGRVWAEDRPMRGVRDYSRWVSQRDAAQGIERSLDKPPNEKYIVVNIGSNNKWGTVDLSYSKQAIGFEPLDSADAYIEK
ncbi:MAG: uronate dehydrogenase/NAD+ dependent glucose-6-phosphate dehydrogenase [Chloroflexi bacterium]|jgi:nucleoside-diphosphate-sugar epimerase|nr:MAG: uronate dehydrogenase/NAD+ dependent glucose-6-phosphate dehydrogenase [Chloroflexota bacterium]